MQTRSSALQQLHDSLSAAADSSTSAHQQNPDDLSPEEALRQKVLQDDDEVTTEEATSAAGVAGKIDADMAGTGGDGTMVEENNLSLEKLQPFLHALEPSQSSNGMVDFLFLLRSTLKHFCYD